MSTDTPVDFDYGIDLKGRMRASLREEWTTDSRELALRVVSNLSPSDLREACVILAEHVGRGVIRHEERAEERKADNRRRRQTRRRDTEAAIEAGFVDAYGKPDLDAYRDYRMTMKFKEINAELEELFAAREFTEQFLSTTFALGDGTRVTWGDASREHHGQRIDLLDAQAKGIEDTISMHDRAIKTLDYYKAARLRDVPIDSVPQLQERTAA